MPNREELLSFVRRSKRRREILNLLFDKTLTATDIEKITKMYKSHVSRALSELDNKGLVEGKNPNDRVFRYYKIISLGRRIIKELVPRKK